MGITTIKSDIKTLKKNGIYYLINQKGDVEKYKPWLGDLFSFLYDKIMEKSIFPKKFNASIDNHSQILKSEFEQVHNKAIIEFATGSGNAVEFLNNTNTYSGIDISAGLLHIAKNKFQNHGFMNFELFICDACQTPFQDNIYEIAICNLSLNFFDDIDKFILELKRVLKSGGTFFCSVPIPEKKNDKIIIRGNLYSTDDLQKKFERNGFTFSPLSYENGALLYFKTMLMEKHEI